MRRITAGLAATTAGIALVIGVKASSASAPRSALAASGQALRGPQGTPEAGASPGSASPGTTGTGTTGTGQQKASTTGSYTGSTVDTRYGPVQVRAVVKAGKLTNVVVLQQTDGGRSSQIDSYALPILTTEALKAQSADIDVVSGATYTSQGYAQSLQAALDAAGR